MSTVWVCAKDGHPTRDDGIGWWCPRCDDDTIAVAVPTVTQPQLVTIWELFSHRGEVNRDRRLTRISQMTGRHIGDYTDLTYEEAGSKVIPALRKWAHGK